jgi:hypothetical protein
MTKIPATAAPTHRHLIDPDIPVSFLVGRNDPFSRAAP